MKALPPQKRLIVRKYVMARNAEEALHKEKTIAPDDCFIDDDWIKAHPDIQSYGRAKEKPLGFK